MVQSPSGRENRPVVLFLHGNAGNISHRLEKLDTLHALGTDTLIVDYRGYGASEGSPDEAGLYRDAAAAYEHLRGSHRIPSSRIVLYGESLGCAVAVDLATRIEAGGLILEAVFTSLVDVGQKLYPFLPVKLLARSRFEVLRRIEQVHAPLLTTSCTAATMSSSAWSTRGDRGRPGPEAARGAARRTQRRVAISTQIYRAALREFLEERSAGR